MQVARKAGFPVWRFLRGKSGDIPHRVLFSDGDLHPHNIVVCRGRIKGFLDWEAAGWYPEY
ncbi:phosphotransferase family protein [Penicillium cataractarum]|uniref:Phosphotransferase family protein n=1 Tax=Penicillium cataractarum TaxID=2100454 RepID=A0A9W9S1J5_9EURO|nr:phosphotransferase family protein [Penicillium cataractarum]KAJ5368929.1 phosphotransferase family protein [Penicillium cataractarum]